MLGKLIKNDLLSGLHTIGAVYVSALIAASVIIFAIPKGSSPIKVALAVTLFAVMSFIVIFTFFAVIVMFNKSVYGNQGYLTLTLPVKSWQMIFSKTLTGIVFTLVSYIAFIGSIIGTIAYLSEERGAVFVEMFWTQLEASGLPSLSTIQHAFFLLAVLGLISIFLIVSSMHMAVTLANVGKLEKLGLFGSVIAFFAIYGVLSSVAERLGKAVGLRIVVLNESYIVTFSDAVALMQKNSGAAIFSLSTQFFMLLFAIALCVGSIVLIQKRVNVK